MKVLSIGNSFSEDAQAYLKGVCDAAGVEMHCANLYIGGCSLVRHYNTIVDGARDHLYVENGVSTGRRVSIREGLAMEDWDVVTLQEHSLRSAQIANFEPYIYEIIKVIKEIRPNARIALHQSWGYGEKLLNSVKNAGFRTTLDMFDGVEAVYKEVLKRTGADLLIPSGKVLRRLFVEGYDIHYDGQHASRGIGRYALALTWLRALFGVRVTGNGFRDFEISVSREEIEAAWAAVDDLAL